MLCFLLKVNGRPVITNSQPIGLAVVMRETVIVLDTILEQKLSTLLGCFPPWRHHASGRFAMLEVFDELVALPDVGYHVLNHGDF